MFLWLLLLPLPLPTLAGVDKNLGISPDLALNYTPSNSGTWQCLDGSKEIPWASVNDDFCDCPDGSDEPGTSACPGGTFYCHNTGHIGATIPSTRVNDGLCEPQCCDGSDERPGVCPDQCLEIGDLYRKKRDAERKIQKTGAKIRSSYISFAHKEKVRLDTLIQTSTQEIAVKEKEVERLQDIVDRTESLSAAALAHKQESPLYKTLITHSNALKSLQREHKKHLEREKALGDILDSLRSGYNPNYQDMAVLEAVRGWEFLAGLPHINQVDKEDSESHEDTETEAKDAGVLLEEGEWTAEQLENELDSLAETDYVSLLLEHEEHIRSPIEGSILSDLSSYIPDSILPYYEEFRDTLVSWMQTLGITSTEVDSSADATHARQALTDAEAALASAKAEKKKAEEGAAELFNIHGFGAEGEWKKLDGTCLEKNTGDYTYEVCLFDEARQKPNSGGSIFSLGKFASWNPSPDVKPGEPEYYQKQVYNKGARCWNGPERNLILLLTCGTENVITSVVELEKCEYQLTGTSPALCLPLDSSNGDKSSREEL